MLTLGNAHSYEGNCFDDSVPTISEDSSALKFKIDSEEGLPFVLTIYSHSADRAAAVERALEEMVEQMDQSRKFFKIEDTDNKSMRITRTEQFRMSMTSLPGQRKAGWDQITEKLGI